jgi:putative flippase GtrA
MEFKRTIKFMIVGGSGVVVNERVFFALTDIAHLYYEPVSKLHISI